LAYIGVTGIRQIFNIICGNKFEHVALGVFSVAGFAVGSWYWLERLFG
jgi:hypothetical protein